MDRVGFGRFGVGGEERRVGERVAVLWTTAGGGGWGGVGRAGWELVFGCGFLSNLWLTPAVLYQTWESQVKVRIDNSSPSDEHPGSEK